MLPTKKLDVYSLLYFADVPPVVIHSLRELDSIESNAFPDPEPFVSESSYWFGPTGCGKTTWATNIMLASIFNTKPVPHYLQALDWKHENHIPDFQPNLDHLFVSVPRLLFDIRQSYSNQGNYSESEIFERCSEVKWLLMDDLGTEATTDWSWQMLYLIINERYNNMLTTIFTSNLSPDKLDFKLKDPRLVSRIIGMSSIHEMDNVDYRKRNCQ